MSDRQVVKTGETRLCVRSWRKLWGWAAFIGRRADLAEGGQSGDRAVAVVVAATRLPQRTRAPRALKGTGGRPGERASREAWEGGGESGRTEPPGPRPTWMLRLGRVSPPLAVRVGRQKPPERLRHWCEALAVTPQPCENPPTGAGAGFKLPFPSLSSWLRTLRLVFLSERLIEFWGLWSCSIKSASWYPELGKPENF